MDKDMKRVKQLLETGHYPAPESEDTTAVCPDCGETKSIWDMSNAHMRLTPFDETVLVCDECYEKNDLYDRRSALCSVRRAISKP